MPQGRDRDIQSDATDTSKFQRSSFHHVERRWRHWERLSLRKHVHRDHGHCERCCSLVFSISGGADSANSRSMQRPARCPLLRRRSFGTPTDSDHNNSYVVQVQASDGSLTDTQNLTVLVFSQANPITASERRQPLDGTPQNDLINGLGGNDTIFANAGTIRSTAATATTRWSATTTFRERADTLQWRERQTTRST